MSKERILKVIDRLPIDYRLLFAEYIMESLSPNDSGIKTTWKDEVQRRMAKVNNGSCEVIPSEDLHNDLYRLFKYEDTGAAQQQISSEGPATLREIIEEIATYSDTERIKIRTAIIQSLHGRPDPEVEEAWAKEVQRRLNEAENGEEETFNIDAIALKRKLSKQFSETYTNEKGLIDRDKLKRDIKSNKKRRNSRNDKNTD